MRNPNAARSDDLADLSIRPFDPHERPRSRTIVIRQGSGWMPFALLCVCLLLIAVVLLGHRELAAQQRRNEQTELALGKTEVKLQQLESGLGFDSRRRQLLLGMRDHILRVNPRVGLTDAYRYAQLALDASDKYPSVDPLLLLSIGTVESRYDPQARSKADARGLYQIWPSTGRLLMRGLGWEYDEQALYDPAKNTQAAALYLDILFSAYSDPQLVLAEYNGGPLNAGYFRAGVRQLSPETRDYVPQVLSLYARLKEKFGGGADSPLDAMYRDAHRDGKMLAGPPRDALRP
jgi:soluble lytic murein transglycosylase-like protein